MKLVPDCLLMPNRAALGLIGTMLLAVNSHATELQQQISDCKKINSYAQAGQKAYAAGQYSKARAAFEDQAAWSHSCLTLFQADQTGFAISDSAVATADNNVALTYIKQGDFLKAKAWLMIDPKDKKSQYNLNLIKEPLAKLSSSKMAQTPIGEYWQYAGNGAWNRLNVTSANKAGTRYKISFFGLYMGLMSMYYGPNMGEFTTFSPIKNGRAVWTESAADDTPTGEGCTVVMTFSADKVNLNTTQGQCGFGHNVDANGDFLRVSYRYTADDLH